MNEIVIVHNKHDKVSRDFVDANPTYQVIDWYGSASDVKAFLDCGLSCISTFPTVVHTTKKVFYSLPASMQVALDEFNDWDFIDGKETKLNGKTKEVFYIEHKVKVLSDLSFALRQKLIPDYKLTNALLGIYSEEIKEDYITCCEAFRTEFYRVKALIEAATTMETIKAAFESASFPTEV